MKVEELFNLMVEITDNDNPSIYIHPSWMIDLTEEQADEFYSRLKRRYNISSPDKSNLTGDRWNLEFNYKGMNIFIPYEKRKSLDEHIQELEDELRHLKELKADGED